VHLLNGANKRLVLEIAVQVDYEQYVVQ